MSWPDDPDIKFDLKGICNYCQDITFKENDRRLQKLERPWIINNIKRDSKNKKYDCLIGLSGGVDSSICLHYLIEQGLKPLAFSIDNGWNTKESDENIMRLVEGLKVPFYRYTIDIKKFQELQIAFILSQTANIEIPTDHILMASTYEMAKNYNIKYIISGGNWQTESIMPKAWGYQPRDLTFIKSVYKNFTHKKLKGLPTISLFQYLIQRFIRGVQVINLLDYYDYNREKAKELLKEKYGWKDYGEKHCESKFTQWFQNYYLPTFFEIDKRKAHYSSMILSGQMTRNNALEKLKEPLEYENIVEIKGNFIRKSYKDYPNSEFWWNLFSSIYANFKRFFNLS